MTETAPDPKIPPTKYEGELEIIKVAVELVLLDGTEISDVIEIDGPKNTPEEQAAAWIAGKLIKGGGLLKLEGKQYVFYPLTNVAKMVVKKSVVSGIRLA